MACSSALASLLSLYLDGIWSSPVYTYTFGEPRSLGLSELSVKNVRKFRFVNKLDLVPTLLPVDCEYMHWGSAYHNCVKTDPNFPALHDGNFNLLDHKIANYQ